MRRRAVASRVGQMARRRRQACLNGDLMPAMGGLRGGPPYSRLDDVAEMTVDAAQPHTGGRLRSGGHAPDSPAQQWRHGDTVTGVIRST
jgi:hypothetical protein